MGSVTTPGNIVYETDVFAAPDGNINTAAPKPICDAQPGWKVRTLDGWTDVIRVSKKRTDSYVVLVLDDNTALGVTATHFLMGRKNPNSKAGWMMAGGIAPNYQLLTSSGWRTVLPASYPVTDVSETVCSIKTSSGTFLVNNVLARD